MTSIKLTLEPNLCQLTSLVKLPAILTVSERLLIQFFLVLFFCFSRKDLANMLVWCSGRSCLVIQILSIVYGITLEEFKNPFLATPAKRGQGKEVR